MIAKNYRITCISIYIIGVLMFFTTVSGLSSIYLAVALDFVLAGVSIWTLAKFVNEYKTSKSKGYYLYMILLLIPFIWFILSGIITGIALAFWRP